MQDTDKLKLRAKRKFLNTPILNHLIDLNSPFKFKYISSAVCSSMISLFDGSCKSMYCKRTWCAVCAPIRTAVRINNYKDQLNELPTLYLTTLTAPNVPPEKIKEQISLFRSIFRQFRNTYKKSTKQVFRGVYNFEITYNVKTKLYHPHIHIIHEFLQTELTGFTYPDGKKQENNSLVRYWLQKNKLTNSKAQDSRLCHDLIEGFKYQSKSIFSIKINGKNEPFVPAKELDFLYRAIQGVRCFQPFGIKKISDSVEDKQLDNLEAYKSLKPDGDYIWQDHDWYTNLFFNQDGQQIYQSVIQKNIINVEIPLSEYKPNKPTISYLKKLEKNEPYKSN